MAKLDRAMGKMDAIMALQNEQGDQLGVLGERIATVELEVRRTKDVVEAWAAAKTTMRFAKWFAGFAGALLSIFVAVKGGMFK